MKNLKKIENSVMNFNLNNKMLPSEMSQTKGGAGCICYSIAFRINDLCACYRTAFGLCDVVNGGGAPITGGKDMLL